MYVCLCKNVTDSQIRQEVAEGGARSMKDLNNKLGVAKQCGRCGQCANRILREAQSRENLIKPTDQTSF